MSKIDKPPVPSVARRSEQKDPKELVGAVIEYMLLDAEKINEGNNGIIKIMDVRQLPRELIEYLNDINPNFFSERNQIAIKILKIYSEGVGRHEYEMQRQSYEAVTKKIKDAIPLAMIPEPLFYKELTIQSEDVKRRLREEGLQQFDNKIEIIIMDLLPGEDMATYLYRQVVKIAEQDPELAKELLHRGAKAEEMNLGELQSTVHRILDFRKPGGKHRTDHDNEVEEEAVKRDNADKLIGFLKKRGFTINKEWIEKINNTISILHQSGIYHRDLHERNVMIDEKNNEIYILDFGSARSFHAEQGEDVYEEVDGRRPNDLSVVKTWGQLITSKEDDSRIALDKISADLDRLINKMLAKEPDMLKKIHESLAANHTSLDKLITEAATSFTSAHGDTYWRIKAALAKELAKEHRQIALDYVAEQINDKTLPPFAANLFRKLDSLLQ